MRPFLSRLARDHRAQDLLEYALLVALVGLAGMAAWSVIRTGLGQAYIAYDTNTQGNWRPNDPLPKAP